jgi:hypothetical protein
MKTRYRWKKIGGGGKNGCNAVIILHNDCQAVAASDVLPPTSEDCATAFFISSVPSVTSSE